MPRKTVHLVFSTLVICLLGGAAVAGRGGNPKRIDPTAKQVRSALKKAARAQQRTSAKMWAKRLTVKPAAKDAWARRAKKMPAFLKRYRMLKRQRKNPLVQVLAKNLKKGELVLLADVSKTDVATEFDRPMYLAVDYKGRFRVVSDRGQRFGVHKITRPVSERTAREPRVGGTIHHDLGVDEFTVTQKMVVAALGRAATDLARGRHKVVRENKYPRWGINPSSWSATPLTQAEPVVSRE